jgi:hypothetical protein
MTKNIIAFLLASITVILTLDAQAQTCTVEKTSVCIDGVCKSMHTSNTWTTIKNDHLLRCDSKGCDKHAISITKSGQYTNVQIPNTSYMLKYDQNLNFIEATSLALTIIVNAGKCNH